MTLIELGNLTKVYASGVTAVARITLRVDPARLYFFDPGTGQATGWPAAEAVLPRNAPAPA